MNHIHRLGAGLLAALLISVLVGLVAVGNREKK